MFKVENNAKIGKYLDNIIKQQYKSRRAFCKAYISESGEEPNDQTIANMNNRLTQIIKGNKAIQTYDLPYFTELLGVSCEQILSAGKCPPPLTNRVTNYLIANSKNEEEWEKYINREDKLFLNADEYCKTVLDYAFEFKNYEFIKYLMDKKYIWFDSQDDKDYAMTFGAETSIKRRAVHNIDCGLQKELTYKDELRIKLIALACDNNDIQMLNDLRAREIPQLYYMNYVSHTHREFPDVSAGHNAEMIEHIASSNEFILDYFTDPFEIRDNVKHKDGSKRTHTFMFPYISELLNRLAAAKSPFMETALKKALRYNEKTYKRLCKLTLAVKNDAYYSSDYMKGVWIKACKDEFQLYEDEDVVAFGASLTAPYKRIEGMITNVPHITLKPATPALKYLADELNESYLKIVSLKEHLEEL